MSSGGLVPASNDVTPVVLSKGNGCRYATKDPDGPSYPCGICSYCLAEMDKQLEEIQPDLIIEDS